MAGPLGVTHLLLLSRSPAGNTNLRLALTPRGPTLHFRVEQYSLCKDVRKAIKHAKGGGKEYQTAPLLVMNNFMSPPPTDGETPAVPKHLESLTTKVFQSLFPAISPQATPLSSIRRVLLLNREVSSSDVPKSATEDGSYIINFRHYAITTKRTGLSKGIRRINAAEKILSASKDKRSLPNLGRLEDVADYLLDPSGAGGGFTSGSESEAETDAEVEVLETPTRKVLDRKKLEALRQANGKLDTDKSTVEKRAVKLVELGPRMKLRMTKVEEGVCGGKVMWHEFLSKSKEEIKDMDAAWEARRKEKEERRRIQKDNVDRKRKEKGGSEAAANGQNELMDEDDWDSEDFELDDDAGDAMDVDGRIEVPS